MLVWLLCGEGWVKREVVSSDTLEMDVEENLQTLADDDPGERTPGHGEGCDEHASGDDHDNSRARVLGWRACDGHRGEDQQPRRLPQSAVDQRNAAAESLDEVQARESRSDVDGSEDELDQQGVVNTSRLEDGRSVVEEVVDAGPLLEELDAETQESAVHNARFRAAAGEALPPASHAGALLLLDAVVHFSEIVLDQLVMEVVLQPAEPRHGHARLFPAVFAGQPAGGLGREQNADAEGE